MLHIHANQPHGNINKWKYLVQQFMLLLLDHVILKYKATEHVFQLRNTTSNELKDAVWWFSNSPRSW